MPSLLLRRQTFGRVCALLIPALRLAGMIGETAPGAGREEFTPVAEFRNFNRHNARGLPQSTVRQLAQDERGVLWLGTMDGLASFDGTEMREVIPPAGLPPFGSINSLFIRPQGGLIAAGTPGVFLCDGRDWRLIRTRPQATSVVETSDARLWVADQTGSVWRSNPAPGESDNWERIMLPVPGAVNKLVTTPDGSVWAVSRSGLIRLKEERVEAVYTIPAAAGAITAMILGHDQTCWIGTQTGRLWRLTAGAERPEEIPALGLPGEAITSLTEDRLGRLWCGTQGGHLAFAHPGQSWTIWGADNGLNGTSGIMSLLADREGTLWLGLNANGVQQLLSEAWRHRQHWEEGSRSRSSGGVFGLTATADGGVLAAVFGHGLWQWDGRHTRQLGAVDGLAENTRCVAEPEPGVIWVGHRYGISESRHGSPFVRTLTLSGGFTTGFFHAPDGTWYAATSTESIYRWSGHDWQAATDLNANLVDRHVRGMTWRSNGELWIVTNNGLTVRHSGGFRQYTAANTPGLPLPANTVLEYNPGEMWVAGLGGILVMADHGWRQITAADGLPGRTVYTLARAPDGSVWAGGSQGVGHFADGRWTIHDTRNGLLDEECNLNGLLITRDGTVYVGTMGGLASFRAAPTPAAPPPLRPFWETIADTAPSPAGGLIRLPREHRTLSAAWSAPWLEATPVEYRTRLLPQQASWSPPSERRDLLIQNLKPGRYQLEVQARLSGTGDQSWTAPLHAEVEVVPEFYETVWGRLLGAVLVVAGAGAAARLWNWRLERKREQLQAAVTEAQANVKTLRGLIPICASCKNIRDDRGAWNQLEAYVHEHSEAEFSHGICPECARKLYPQFRADEPPPSA